MRRRRSRVAVDRPPEVTHVLEALALGERPPPRNRRDPAPCIRKRQWSTGLARLLSATRADATVASELEMIPPFGVDRGLTAIRS
jgi:hypothetical protein